MGVFIHIRRLVRDSGKPLVTVPLIYDPEKKFFSILCMFYFFFFIIKIKIEIYNLKKIKQIYVSYMTCVLHIISFFNFFDFNVRDKIVSLSHSVINVLYSLI